MIDDTVIEKPFSKTNECVYWQYSSKNADFITGISLTVLLWSDGVKNIPIIFMVYEKDTNGKPIKTKNEFALESIQYALRLGIRPYKVCFDSKYSSSKLLNRLDNNNLRYYVYACIHALILLERQNKRSLYEAKKYFQQKFIGVKHNGNRALRLLAA